MSTDYTDPTTALSAEDAARADQYHNLFRDYAVLTRMRQVQADVASALAGVSTLAEGVVAYNELAYTGLPTDTNTVTIGADVYEFCTAAGSVAANGNIGVVIGTSNATAQNLVNAINGLGTGDVHPTLFRTDGTTPAHSDGTENVLAVYTAGKIYLYNADAPGGTKVEGAAPSLAFSDTADNYGPFKWSNFNLSTGAGYAGTAKALHTKVVVAAGDLTATQPLLVPVPFAPQSWNVQARDAAGVAVDGYVAVTVPAAVAGQDFLGLDIAPTSPTTLKRKEFVLPLGAGGIATHFEWNPPRGVIPQSYKFVRGATLVGATLTIALDRITRSTGAVQAALSTAVDVAGGTNDVEQAFTPSVSMASSAHAIAATQGLKGTLKPDATATAPGSVTFIVEYIERLIATDVVMLDVYGV